MRVVVGGRRLYKLNVLLVVLLLWCIPWWLYNRFILTKDFHPMSSVKWDATPRWLSCAIPYVSRDPEKDDCAAVKLDGWSVGHVLIYATVGMVLPGQWAAVLGISILFEAFEYVVGWRARWLMDPATNLVGYAIGHADLFSFLGLRPLWGGASLKKQKLNQNPMASHLPLICSHRHPTGISQASHRHRVQRPRLPWV